MDEQIRAVAADIDVLCDRFFEAGFKQGVLAERFIGDVPLLDRSEHINAAMHQARSEYWASFQGRFAALLENM